MITFKIQNKNYVCIILIKKMANDHCFRDTISAFLFLNTRSKLIKNQLSESTSKACVNKTLNHAPFKYTRNR